METENKFYHAKNMLYNLLNKCWVKTNIMKHRHPKKRTWKLKFTLEVDWGTIHLVEQKKSP